MYLSCFKRLKSNVSFILYLKISEEDVKKRDGLIIYCIMLLKFYFILVCFGLLFLNKLLLFNYNFICFVCFGLLSF